MKKSIIKVFSVILVVVLTLTSAPLSGFVGLELPEWLDFSIESKAATSGTCGENLTWTFDVSTGTLTISGTGPMFDYSYESGTTSPWYSFNNLTSTVIENGVTSIGTYAFRFCQSLTSVTIADSVTTIGDKAFCYCDALKNIEIPASLISIGNSAFDSCDNLASVTIGSGVTTIGGYVFFNCRSLKSITIPNSVTTIGNHAFDNCERLTSIVVDGNNQYYSSDEYGVLYNKDKTAIIKYPIGNTRTSYAIPDSVTSIGAEAFDGCSYLKSITIHDGVTSIGSSAFSRTGYYYDTNNWEKDVLYIGNHLVDTKDSISGDYVIKDGTLTIAGDAFGQSENLTSVMIPNSVTTIGGSAFYLCVSLESIIIPDSVTKIDDRAFGSCKSLTNVTLPDGITEIGESVFDGCSSLKNITIPDSVTMIGSSAFYGCSSLKSITIPDSVIMIGERAFQDCTKLISVTIPDSIIAIGSMAFYDCYNLRSVHITDMIKWFNIKFDWYPSNPLSYGAELLLNGERVTDLVIFDDVTTINPCAFYGCSSLESLTVPDTVTTISEFAFSSCKNLASVVIGDSVTTIDRFAFSDCENLIEVKIGNSVSTIGQFAFSNCKSLISFTVDSNNQFYSNDEYGVLFNRDKTTLIQYTNGNAQTSYSIPNTVTMINNSAFMECISLTSVIIPDSVTTIGERAFDNCRRLKSITISNSVTTIGGSAFRGCISLTSVTIPDSVTTIGRNAFCECTNLTSVTIPNSVTTIDYNAFRNCYILTDVYYGGTKEQWKSISIGDWNYSLTNAKIHYNNCSGYCNSVILPTCTTQGYTTYVCECGYSYEKDYVDALGHTDGETVEENYVASTCTETGSKDNVTYCTVCNAETSRKEIIIDATGHTEEEMPAVAPDCTNTGLTSGVKCSVCGEILTVQQEIPANGHNYNSVVTAPTCTDRGYTSYTCSSCGEGYVGDYTDSLGHKFANGTCTECNATDPNYFTFSIQEPSTKQIRCNDGIILHTNITGDLPQGARIEWTSNNNNFNVDKSSDGKEITIISKNNGYTTFTATVYDADNNVIAQDVIEIYSKASFFDKIGGFFRSLFGTTKIYEN